MSATRYPVRDRHPNPRYLESPEEESARLQEEIKDVERRIRESAVKHSATPRRVSATDRPGYSRALPKPNLASLREMPSVKKAAQQMAAMWSDTESSASASSGDASADTARGHKRGKRHLKSGMELKVTDKVKYQVKWPHTQLQAHFVSQGYKFSELTWPLFFAGELEAIASSLTPQEKEARLNLLKILAYHSNLYPFKAITEWYAAFMQRIEKGISKWDQDPYMIGQVILARYRPEEKSVKKGKLLPTKVHSESGRKQITVWFCANFNRNKCQLESPHEATVRGKRVNVEHICAPCWLKNRVRSVHAECSTDCPLFTE